jgi:hypothetical protein
MGLILPNGPSWGRWTHNYGAVSTITSSTAYGTAHLPGPNSVTPADGSATTVLSALAHDCEYLVLGFSGFGAANQDQSTFLDLLIDTTGGTSWTELMADLLVGMLGSTVPWTGGNGPPLMYHFPIWLPAGTSIGVRSKTFSASVPSPSPRVLMLAAGDNKNPGSWWCGQKIETVGTLDQNACRGQGVTCGASGSFGSWANLGSTLSARGGAVQFGVQGAYTAAVTNQSSGTYYMEFGFSSAAAWPPIYKSLGSGETASHWFHGPMFYDVPAGAHLQVRGGSSLSSPQVIDVAAYVVQ